MTLKKHIAALTAACLLAASAIPAVPLPAAAAAITVDGDASDWAGVATQSGNDLQMAMKHADGGYYIYVQASNGLIYNSAVLTVTSNDGTQIADQYSKIVLNIGGGSVLDNYWSSIQGASAAASDISNGQKTYEAFIPESFFASQDFTLSGSGVTFKSTDLTGSTETPTDPTQPDQPTEPEKPAQYNGITIDGQFSDWASHQHVDTSTIPESKVRQMDMIWDGDYVYLYLDELQKYSAAWSGPSAEGGGKTGNFIIKTDTGKSMLVHFERSEDGQPPVVTVQDTKDGTFYSSADAGSGVSLAVNDTYYSNDVNMGDGTHLVEIAIPTKYLPPYRKTISFGYYGSDPVIQDQPNLHPVESENGKVSDGSNIVYDGNYSDWTYYPHTIIEYDTSGTWGGTVDGEGALYSNGRDLYGNVYTTHPSHLTDGGEHFGGYEFHEFHLYVDGQFIDVLGALVDSNGNLIKDANAFRNLPDGQYTVKLFDNQTWANVIDGHTADDYTTPGKIALDQYNPNAGYYYGEMKFTVEKGARDECEFKIDTAVLAEKLGIDPNSINKIDAQFHLIGDELITASGASTLPAIPVAAMVGMAGLAFYKRKKENKGNIAL